MSLGVKYSAVRQSKFKVVVHDRENEPEDKIHREGAKSSIARLRKAAILRKEHQGECTRHIHTHHERSFGGVSENVA